MNDEAKSLIGVLVVSFAATLSGICAWKSWKRSSCRTRWHGSGADGSVSVSLLRNRSDTSASSPRHNNVTELG